MGTRAKAEEGKPNADPQWGRPCAYRDARYAPTKKREDQWTRQREDWQSREESDGGWPQQWQRQKGGGKKALAKRPQLPRDTEGPFTGWEKRMNLYTGCPGYKLAVVGIWIDPDNAQKSWDNMRVALYQNTERVQRPKPRHKDPGKEATAPTAQKPTPRPHGREEEEKEEATPEEEGATPRREEEAATPTGGEPRATTTTTLTTTRRTRPARTKT